ncbi:MAG: GHMP kinase [Candidatus Aegiribacteria sp.]|nr:GHMP kinase [Candidatus Aegiribacteria sp.]
MNKIDLFVPGRLCLFGEHSDWAGEYRKTDTSVGTGCCIVAGTDQGIYGTAEPASTGFHISQILPDGSHSSLNSYSSEPELLREVAESAVFDSYAAGTASIILKKHPNLGLRLRIHRRTLPIKKGLSSSAAVCVLTARAFNSIHTLNLSVQEEMELAYRGELLTGSHCGRMDQACAYGVDPVLLTFDGDEMTVSPLLPGGPLHILIVDLQGRKNTRRILEELNLAFVGGNVHIRRALGAENHRITAEACDAIERGDAKDLGRLMIEAQRIFDELVAPVCPSELRSPGLHEILASRIVRSLAWGGKGVGSQGDGTAQFICKGPGEREELRTVLEAETDVECYFLTI